jgi:hypothetical protein
MGRRSLTLSLGTVAVFGLGVALGSQTQPAAPQTQPPANPNTVYSTYSPVDGKGGEEVSGPYDVVKGWPQFVTPGWTINAEGIYVESPDRIIAVGRGTRKSPWTTFWGPAAFRNLGRPIPPPSRSSNG